MTLSATKEANLPAFSANHLLNNFFVCVVYILLWIPAWHFSVNLETISGVVSWFLPAGIRLSFLLFLPVRYWPGILVGELISTHYIQLLVINLPFAGLFQMMVHNSLMILAYMLCTWQYLKKYQAFHLSSVSELLGLFRWLMIILISAAVLFNINLPDEQSVTLLVLLERSLAFALGDLVGIIAILVPVALIKQLIEEKINPRRLGEVILAVSIIIGLYLIRYLVGEGVATHAKVLSMMLFIIIAYQYYSLGAGISVLAVNATFIIGISLGINLGEPIDNQLFLISTTLTCLFIGAATGEMSQLTSRLQKRNDQLSRSLNKNQSLARELVDVQENERIQIARELHDDIGQNITAIKINLAVAKSLVKDLEVIGLLDSTEIIANKIYTSTRDLMNSLYPRVLDEIGLERALSRGVLGQSLKNAGIEYNLQVRGDLNAIDSRIALVIYRIAQEASNNTIKHSGATQFDLSLNVSDATIDFSVADNGKGFDDRTVTKGMGLNNIHNRVSAVNGEYSMISGSKGTFHQVRFHLS